MEMILYISCKKLDTERKLKFKKNNVTEFILVSWTRDYFDQAHENAMLLKLIKVVYK